MNPSIPATHRRGRTILAAAAAVIAVTLAACGNEEASRTAGQPADSTVAQRATDAARATGERISEGAAELRKEAGEAIGQATGAVSDAAITAAINAELVRDEELSPMDVEVDTVGGRVALTGKVPSEAARERAESIASRIDGVVAVENRLTVSTS
jgi:hyperosmotically inducible periplasmic protein